MVLEKTPEGPFVCKEIKPVNPKENQSWTFIERTGAEAEAPVLWLPDGQSRLIGEDPDARKEQAEEVSAEDEMVSITDSVDMNLSKLKQTVKDREAWRAIVHGVAKS